MEFIQLYNIIHHPALSGLLSYLFIFGVFFINVRIYCIIFKENNILIKTCSFYFVLGCILSLTLIISYFELINYVIIKYIFYTVCIMGIVYIYQKILSINFNTILEHKKNFITHTNNYTYYITILTLIFYFLLSISATTDADSLDYHLGVPLNILREGGIFHHPEWKLERVIGLGEYLNLIGLIIGTDNIGSCLNYFSFCLLLYMAYNATNDKYSNIILFYLILVTPLFLFLIPNSKPQLYGVCAIITSLIACINIKSHNIKYSLIIIGSLIFAPTLKYQFYLSGGICFIIMLYLHRRMAISFIGISIFIYIILLLPLHLIKIDLYGNPIAPMLSEYFNGNRIDNIHWRHFLEYFIDSTDGYPMPLGLIIPNRLGNVSQIIGLGFLGILFIKKFNNISKNYFIPSILLFISIILFGQNVSRSFLEPLLLLYFGISFVINYNTSYFKYFKILITIQLTCIFFSALVGVIYLSPSIISYYYRNNVMKYAAAEYSVMAWADGLLPADSCVISDYRSSALLPRKFVANGYALLMENQINKNIIFRKCRNSNNIYLLSGNILGPTDSHILQDYIILPKLHSRQFSREARNPFNTMNVYWGNIYKIDNTIITN